MWAEIVKNLAKYDSAVLSGVDANGFPFSIRCRPVADPERQVLRIERPSWAPLQPGPAGLLAHSHNEVMWNLVMFNLRGRLEEDGDGWLFRPVTIITGGVSGSVMTIFGNRQRAMEFLKKRNLPRPAIPWDDYKELHKEIE
jgi:hypothetical protein